MASIMKIIIINNININGVINRKYHENIIMAINGVMSSIINGVSISIISIMNNQYQ
jgi:hypothetical protein